MRGICLQVLYLRSQVGLLVGISCVVAALGAFAICEKKATSRLRDLRQWERTLTDRAFELLQENNDLRAQIVQFHQDDHHLEQLARTKLSLVREREIVYRFADTDDTHARSAERDEP